MREKKKRLCLFAGFDAQSEIADYVVYYLKALSQIADVYYWGDFETSDAEKAKIQPYCKEVYCAKHGKYDFGSWQELIQKIGRKNIAAYDELILANDSCYAPLFDLSELFSKMDKRNCDFWGVSAAYRQHIHLQSYFVVLKQPVIQSDVFYDFFQQIKPEANYCDVCATYEDRFTYLLSKAGFHFSSYIDYNDITNHPYRDMMATIQKRHFPFLKVKFFLGGIRDQAGVADWRQVIREDTNYPVSLIEEDLVRRGFDLSSIDKAVQEKQSETPIFYPQTSFLKKIIKQAGKIILKPIIRLADTYIGSRTSSYFYKVDRINRSYRGLQQKYDELLAQVNPDFIPQKIHLVNTDEKCDLKLTDIDASIIKRFDLELLLTNESSVLLVGNISTHNLASLELYDPQTIFLNNNWQEDLKIRSATTDNLCDFKFVDESKNRLYFDFILVQPLEKGSSDKAVKEFIANLKEQMTFESVLALIVPNPEVEKYQQILQSEGLHPASSDRGLVVRSDPFQVYCDKIGSIKGYKALVYKIK